MGKSAIDLQGDPDTVKKLETIIQKLNASKTTDAFFVSLLQSHDEITSCVIGLKKEISVIVERLAVIETKVSVFGSIGSKVGRMLLGGILT